MQTQEWIQEFLKGGKLWGSGGGGVGGLYILTTFEAIDHDPRKLFSDFSLLSTISSIPDTSRHDIKSGVFF